MNRSVEKNKTSIWLWRDFLRRYPLRNGLLGLGFGLIGLGLLLPMGDATIPETSEPVSLDLPDQAETDAEDAPAEAPADAMLATAEQSAWIEKAVEKAIPNRERIDWKSLEVGSGDNLAAVFQRAGLSARDVHDVVSTDEQTAKLTRLYPGDRIDFHVDDTGALQALRYAFDETRTLHLKRNGDGFDSRIETRTLDRRVVEAQGRITSSLYNAALDAGLDDRLIMELAGIFGWDIDFALDIRRDDRFTVIYEELYRDGEKIRNGKILAAEFVNRGERFRALRYEGADGRNDYYAPDGRSMRKAFLRTPTDFTRVSSEFNPARVHPVYGTKRPHVGTDYAAPPGTPIKAAGDGKIIHRGAKGGYGNTVILQHGTRYTTLYAHMRGFANGHSTGDRVSQGEIIGYVGSTGLSTGPHLHYEFRVDGTHRNPRTVELPKAEPIDEQYRQDFERRTEAHLARLDQLSRTRLVQASD
jgi:murein DD-endopeptidase MepM/ murein hydrolase activator NlpD